MKKLLIGILFLFIGCGQEPSVSFDRGSIAWQGSAYNSAYLADAWYAVTDCAGR